MFDRCTGFRRQTIVFLIVFGFIGLLCCAGIERLFFGGDDVNTPPLLFAAEIVFTVIYMLTLLVIFPVQILYFRRKNRADADLLPKATLKDVAGIPFGVYQPDAKLPKWISFPVLAILWFLIAVLLLFLVLGLLAGLINVFIPE